MRATVARVMLGAALVLAAASASAQDWGNLATISSTLGVNANRLCLGEGLRASDIGCPSYAPYVSPTGYVGIGTTGPAAKLDVVGSYGQQLILGTTSQGGGIYFRRGSDGTATGCVGFGGASDAGLFTVSSAGGAGRFIEGFLLRRLQGRQAD